MIVTAPLCSGDQHVLQEADYSDLGSKAVSCGDLVLLGGWGSENRVIRQDACHVEEGGRREGLYLRYDPPNILKWLRLRCSVSLALPNDPFVMNQVHPH